MKLKIKNFIHKIYPKYSIDAKITWKFDSWVYTFENYTIEAIYDIETNTILGATDIAIKLFLSLDYIEDYKNYYNNKKDKFVYVVSRSGSNYLNIDIIGESLIIS